jgi:hypothetical protein
MVGRSPGEILSAMKSHEATVAEHVQKLATPAKFAKGWDLMTDRERAGLINKWQKDLRRNQDLADIMRGLYDDLTRGYGQIP